jgi:tRNA-dihydrouridine synthase A
MMEYTDRHYRMVMRQLTRRTLLYSEMVVAKALIHGDQARHLDFDTREKPLALQLGGDDPAELAEAAVLGQQWGYDEINLNVGCPSDRVQQGRFGACLMAHPELVASCIDAMQKRVATPVTVKHRIGIDGRESYEHLSRFVDTVAATGCKTFIVHARIAILAGLSPKQNRQIPPLRYDDVSRLKREHPELEIVINGGIKTWPQIDEQLALLDGVMIGRAAVDTPFLFAAADARLAGSAHQGKRLDGEISPTRREALEGALVYLEQALEAGAAPHHVTRHLLNLFAGQRGNKAWKHHLSDTHALRADPTGHLRRGMALISDELLDAHHR